MTGKQFIERQKRKTNKNNVGNAKARIIYSTANMIYNNLCNHYNAVNITVPISLYNMILKNVEQGIREATH